MAPKMPKLQSMSRHRGGMPRSGPAMRASGRTPRQAMRPNCSDPLVADGVAQRAEEGYGEDQVGEGEPVGAVGEERVANAVIVQRLVDTDEPESDALPERLR